MNINYQKELERIIAEETLRGNVPSLLLHSCCAPCSSYVLEYLSNYFRITVFYYNPNIYPLEEFQKRMQEQKEFISKLKTKYPVSFMASTYRSEEFYDLVRGLEHMKEGEERCFKCYRLRLEEAATIAKKNHFDYFTTTLSISPYKNSAKLNAIGKELEEKYHISYLYADFKKKNGYRRSIELSELYHLYRQDYCGCIYSKLEREAKKREC